MGYIPSYHLKLDSAEGIGKSMEGYDKNDGVCFLYIYIYIYIYIYLYIYISIYIYIYVCVCVCVYACISYNMGNSNTK